jgi:hypothetical protein
MSQNPDPTTEPVVATTHPRTDDVPVVETRDRGPSRAVQAAAWVGIVAGTVFVIAVIFFSGFILGKHSGGGGFDGPRHHHQMMFRDGGGPPMMRPGQNFGPGGPGMYGPGPAQPPQQPGETATTAPARP